MLNDLLRQLIEKMRSVSGTRWEPARNGLLRATQLVLDSTFVIERNILRIRKPHPLMSLISNQAGNPTEMWDVSNVPQFRKRFDFLLDYLPKSLPKGSCITSVTEGSDGPLAYIRVSNHSPSPRTDIRHIVYLHGGGFVLGDAESVLPEAARFADLCRAQVDVIEYPLAPECKFPKTVGDVGLSMAAICTGPGFTVVAESAGANLAIAALLRDELLLAKCQGLVLFYPFLDLRLESDSVHEHGRDRFLTKDLLEWFRSQYVAGEDWADPQISPIVAGNLKDLPPTYCVVGEYDPLRDDALGLASRTDIVEVDVVPGLYHGFMQMRGVLHAREKYLKRSARFINAIVPGSLHKEDRINVR